MHSFFVFDEESYLPSSRPTFFGLFLPRQFLPWIVKMGPASLRRKIGKLIPWKDLHRIFDLVDIMDATSREIYDQKKEALAKGDDAVLQQVGMGKDIMSILRKSPFLLSVF